MSAGSLDLTEEPTFSIVATSQQTRFHVGAASTTSAEIDIKDLSVSIVSSTGTAKGKKIKGKKTVSEIEILTDAELRIKAGTVYGLLGRNGTGKSTILRAIAQKLIPGLRYDIRIASLQQTDEDRTRTPDETAHEVNEPSTSTSSSKTVLQQVIESDASRNIVLQDLKGLSSLDKDGVDNRAQLRRYRKVRHDRLVRELLQLRNSASLKSGARGAQARKDLIAFEKRVDESQAIQDQDINDVEPEVLQHELDEASGLLSQLQSQVESISLVDIEAKARNLLNGLGFAESSFSKPYHTLSGGWRMRCMLAGVLIQDVDIMILDEPTNFLDLPSIMWLQEHLLNLQTLTTKSVVVVSHDRDFMDNICEEIITLRDKKLEYFRGNLSAHEKELRARVLYLTRMQEAQDRENARLKKTIHANIKAGNKTGDDNKLRMAKSRQKKMEDRSGMQVGATGGRFKLSRDRAGFQETKLATIDIPTAERAITLTIPEPPDLRFPGALLSLEDISFRYSKHDNLVLQDVCLTIHNGDRVGIVGVNGCGKSTLIKLVNGVIEATKGQATRHPRLRLGYYSQHAVEELQGLGHEDPSRTALNMLAEKASSQMSEQDMRALLGSFGLPGRTASDVPISKLSGGQMVRLALVLIVRDHPNLLVLDEVTTHLDYDTVNALAEALAVYRGALLVVSHDRYLIRRVIQGEEPETLDDDESHDRNHTRDGDSHGGEDDRKRSVLLLKGGRLKSLAGGMADFEATLTKRVAKM